MDLFAYPDPKQVPVLINSKLFVKGCLVNKFILYSFFKLFYLVHLFFIVQCCLIGLPIFAVKFLFFIFLGWCSACHYVTTRESRRRSAFSSSRYKKYFIYSFLYFSCLGFLLESLIIFKIQILLLKPEEFRNRVNKFCRTMSPEHQLLQVTPLSSWQESIGLLAKIIFLPSPTFQRSYFFPSSEIKLHVQLQEYPVPGCYKNNIIVTIL